MSVMNLRACLNIINMKDKAGNPYPFTIDVYTLNKNSKSGGALRRFENVKLLVKTPVKKTLGSLTKSASTLPTARRNPQHKKNRTKNIEFPNGAIKTIHTRLIDSINGKKIVY